MNEPTKRKIHRVLLVEDDEGIIQFILAALNRYNFFLRHAGDGRFALKCLNDESFDLVLCDIMMPYVDGFKLIETAKTVHKKLPPIVMLSALHDVETVLRSKELGAAGYLVKPVTAQQLLAKVKAVLALADDDLVDKSLMPFSVTLGKVNNELLVAMAGCPVKNPISEIIRVMNTTNLQGKASEVQIQVPADFQYSAYAIDHLDKISEYLRRTLSITRNNVRFTGGFFNVLEKIELAAFKQNHLVVEFS